MKIPVKCRDKCNGFIFIAAFEIPALEIFFFLHFTVLHVDIF